MNLILFSAFMKSGNVNFINDVLKNLHDCGCKPDQVISLRISYESKQELRMMQQVKIISHLRHKNLQKQVGERKKKELADKRVQRDEMIKFASHLATSIKNAVEQNKKQELEDCRKQG
ncbi:hypothetical protein Fmac_009401 [Flemingia macrophylla]|uniref:Uncharacterized protein n=1 Tax=Flemingia macrophylla TaxID=520843 RepID=A0ABD1N0P5_9FABA